MPDLRQLRAFVAVAAERNFTHAAERLYLSQQALSAPLRPTPAALMVPAGHRLAGEPAVRLAQLDGERLLTWNPPGTPFTDLLVMRLAAAGAQVRPVQARITGGGEPLDLTEAGAVAVTPEGWPTGPDVVQVPIEDDVTLPLLVLWPAGAPTAAVDRIRSGMATGG